MVRLRQLPPRLATLPARVAALPRVGDPFYRSREWRALVAARKLDGDWFGAKARAKADGSPFVVLDHRVERKDGGADLDPANTQWLTHTEHQAKTAKAARARLGRG